MNYIVDLHCGHGISIDGTFDCGCTYSPKGAHYTEASLMLPITKVAVTHMRASGIKVYSDSDKNNDKNMIADVRDANARFKSESGVKHIYMSVHCDYSEASSGVMPLYTSDEGKKIANAVNASIKAGVGIKSKGAQKGKSLFELEETLMPAVILETGAIKADLAVLRDVPELYGKAIARGICNYYGIEFKEASASSEHVATATAKLSETVVSAAQLKSLQKLLGVSQSGYIGGQDKAQSIYYSGLYKLCKYDGGSGKSTTVKALQKAVGTTADGILGPNTIKAFQKFLNSKQTKYKLDVDGYFGEQSVKALVLYLGSNPSKIQPKAQISKNKVPATSTNITRAKFLKALQEVADDCVSHKFVYSNNGSKTTYKAALKSNKRINCARYVSWAMQRAGLLPAGKVIWLSKKINGNGASYIKKSGKVSITYPKKKPKSAGLVAGDICGFSSPHTMVAANSKGTSWFSAGGSDVKAKKYYYRRKASYDNKLVYVRIRVK